MPRQGEELHQLVSYLERAVADQSNVTVESPKFISDKSTGRPREHDIVITQRFPQRTITTAIECRDKSRPVDVGQIEAFRTKCDDTGIDKRVIVSGSSFYKTARMKAERYGIDCLDFSQIESVDWLVQQEIVFRNREAHRTHIEVGAPLSMQGKNGCLFLSVIDGPDEEVGIRMSASGDVQFTLEGEPNKLVDQIMEQAPDPTSDLSGTLGIDIENPEDFYFLDDDGAQHPLKKQHLDIYWEATETTSPLTFHRYGVETEQPAYEAVSTAAMSVAGHRARVMFVTDAERDLRILIATEPETIPKKGIKPSS